MASREFRREALQDTALFIAAHEQHKRGNLADAISGYGATLDVNPEHVDALHWLGVAQAQRGDLAKARTLIEHAIAIDNSRALFWTNYGNVLRALTCYDDALEAYDEALKLEPNNRDTLYNRANQLFDLRRWSEALKCYEAAYNAGRQDLETVRAVTECLLALDRHEAALMLTEKVRNAQPRNEPNLLLNAYALAGLFRFEDALAVCDELLALSPSNAKYMGAKALWLVAAGRAPEAENAARQALEALGDTGDAGDANRALGRALAVQGRLAEAVAIFTELVEKDPQNYQNYLDRANCARQLFQFGTAFSDYERALGLAPGELTAIAGILECQLALCRWEAINERVAQLEAGIEAGRAVPSPFLVAGLSRRPELVCLAAHKNYDVGDIGKGSNWAQRHISEYTRPKLRIGYLSSDLGQHAIGFQIAEMFESHDRKSFEVFGFSSRCDDRSARHRRIMSAFDHVANVVDMSADQLAQTIMRAELDVIIDLNGLTHGNRLRALRNRPAPVQVTYLGYPGTTAAPFIDYVVADKIVLPPSELKYWTEQPLWMPHSYQVSDCRRSPTIVEVSRQSEGLPESGFIFACFNGPRKILPDVFSLWMELLREVANSVLWLVVPDAEVQATLRTEAVQCNVAPERLIFTGYVEEGRHLARQKLADLFLDTLPYNAHGTASFSLWGGLPVLTCRGTTFAGRVGASLLSALEMPELITETLADYKAAALSFAKDPLRLEAIKAKLARNQAITPLFNTKRFTADFERGLEIMIDRHRRGQAPAPIDLTTDRLLSAPFEPV